MTPSETSVELNKPEDWERITGITIMDADGWRSPGDPPYEKPISRDEFMRRMSISTICASLEALRALGIGS